MHDRDRLASIGLLLAAFACWALVGYVFLTLDPRGNAGVLLAGGLLLGAAVGLSVVPLLWLAGFARARRIAYRGDWPRALRRGALVGLVVAIFVVLRGQGLLSAPLGLFVLAMAAFVELSLSVRR
jgi:hypothetical protein